MVHFVHKARASCAISDSACKQSLGDLPLSPAETTTQRRQKISNYDGFSTRPAAESSQVSARAPATNGAGAERCRVTCPGTTAPFFLTPPRALEFKIINQNTTQLKLTICSY